MFTVNLRTYNFCLQMLRISITNYLLYPVRNTLLPLGSSNQIKIYTLILQRFNNRCDWIWFSSSTNYNIVRDFKIGDFFSPLSHFPVKYRGLVIWSFKSFCVSVVASKIHISSSSTSSDFCYRLEQYTTCVVFLIRWFFNAFVGRQELVSNCLKFPFSLWKSPFIHESIKTWQHTV